jgi:pilus assembly protein FimV
MWGNKDAFLKAAKSLAPRRAEGPAGDWDKVLIMGRQLLPDELLFQEQPSAPQDAGGMDFNLEGGHSLIDFDVFDEPAPEPVAPAAPVVRAAALPDTLDLSTDDPLEQTDSLKASLDEAALQLRDEAEIPLVDRTTEISLDDLDLANVDFDVAGGALEDSRVMRALRGETSAAAVAAPALEIEDPADGRVLDAATLSEVGTKLDLARAYVDMGDPSGARSILDEVLQEGSAAQCQEARRMLSAIPG